MAAGWGERLRKEGLSKDLITGGGLRLFKDKRCALLGYNERYKFNTGEEKMSKWECTDCGYIYDPALGDEDGGIAPGTAFEDLPADWVCPDCGASKDMFERI